MFGARSAWLFYAAIAIGGCSVEQNTSIAQPPSQLDEAVFACTVEPILARQCSYSACHGQASSPLRVYSPGKLRQMPPGDLDASAAPLTQAEHDANFAAASGFGVGQATVDDNFLLKKPLPATSGGFEHTGGAIFSGTEDPQYVAIRAWLAGTGSCP